MALDPALAGEAYCYLTTTGRHTGTPHEIEIWFGLAAGTLYLLAGSRERADWVRNIQRQPEVTVRLRDTTYEATARLVEPGSEEDAMARKLLVDKYESTTTSGDLTDWGRTSLPVALDIAIDPT